MVVALLGEDSTCFSSPIRAVSPNVVTQTTSEELSKSPKAELLMPRPPMFAWVVSMGGPPCLGGGDAASLMAVGRAADFMTERLIRSMSA